MKLCLLLFFKNAKLVNAKFVICKLVMLELVKFCMFIIRREMVGHLCFVVLFLR